MRHPLLLFVLTAAVLVRIGSAAETFTFYPDWFPGAQFAGLYSAIDQGFYQDAGLDVSIVPFAFGQKADQLMAATPDRSAAASIEGYIFLQKRAQGIDWVALSAVLQQAPAGFMSLRRSGITRATDFAGKTIGIHKFADPLYHWFVRRAGLSDEDSKMLFVGNDLDLLIRGEISAMQGFAIEEFVQLKQRVGYEARFLSFTELGFDSYSQIIISNRQQIAHHRAAMRAFLSATRRGWVFALANPEIAVASIHRRVGADCDDVFQRSSLLAVGDYVCPQGHLPLAPMNPEKWRRLQATCVDIGLIKQVEPIENFLSVVEVDSPSLK